MISHRKMDPTAQHTYIVHADTEGAKPVRKQSNIDFRASQSELVTLLSCCNVVASFLRYLID